MSTEGRERLGSQRLQSWSPAGECGLLYLAAFGKGREPLVTESGILTQAARSYPGMDSADTPIGLSSNPTQSDSNLSKFNRRLGHSGDRLRGLK